MESALALESQDIQKKFGHFTALGGVSIQIPKGEFVTLFGRNGAGQDNLPEDRRNADAANSRNTPCRGIDIRKNPNRRGGTSDSCRTIHSSTRPVCN
jgi:ABC-type branched-subunit amino acid transport system ATPase component